MESLLNILQFKYRLYAKRIGSRLLRICNWLLLIVSLVVISSLVLMLGYQLSDEMIHRIEIFDRFALMFLSLFGTIAFVAKNRKGLRRKIGIRVNYYFNIVTLIIASFLFIVGEHTAEKIPVIGLFIEYDLHNLILFILAFNQISAGLLRFLNTSFLPSRLFAISFLVFILIGTGLLSLPKCHQVPISIVDALFTSTSCVCITGLTVVNVAETFTKEGRFIMLILIQIGGLGVLTFTTLFGLVAMGKTSIRNSVLIKDLLNQESFNDIFQLMRLIFFTTLVIEFIGAIWLFNLVGDPELFPMRMAIFHSISAFCNAGFSTLPEGFDTQWLKYNWNFLFAVSIIVSLGSIGFPIVNNLRVGLIHFLRNVFNKLGLKRKFRHEPNLITLNTRIAVIMTIILLSSGTVFFYFSESDGILKDMPFEGKIATAFFMSVTPRSGGFNCYPMASMSQMAVLMTMMLMWIGGGPLSTGGGVKTTTFGLSVMTIWNIMRGRDFVQIRHRRISSISVMRASALVFISVLLTGAGSTIIQYFDPHISFRDGMFEILSAISTCGLSMDVSPNLSTPSKMVDIAFMFFGRVGLLVIMESLVSNEEKNNYTYPTDYIAVG